MERLKSHLQPNIPVTLFMTSCFSGGWLTQPITNTAQHINSTGMTAAGEDSKSVSWPLSASLRRACWGRFATAVLQSTLAIEESQEIYDGVNDIRNDPTYIAFAAPVHETYRRLDSFSDERQIQFSAQDDRWGDHFIRRSGLPLSQFRARWKSLRSIPQGDYDQGGDEVSRTGSMPFGTLRKRSKLEFAAREYLRAHPGEGYEASNVGLHGELWAFLRRQKRFSDKDIDDLLAAVKYRADALSQANKLAAVMKINNPFFNAYTYNEHWQRSPEEDKIYKVAWRLVVTKRLVDKPSPYVPYYLPSRSWTKPNSFLAMCFAKAGLTPTEVEEKISLALSHKKEEAEDISRRYGSHAMGDAEVARHREQLLNKIRSFKAKMMGTSRG